MVPNTGQSEPFPIEILYNAIQSVKRVYPYNIVQAVIPVAKAKNTTNDELCEELIQAKIVLKPLELSNRNCDDDLFAFESTLVRNGLIVSTDEYQDHMLTTKSKKEIVTNFLYIKLIITLKNLSHIFLVFFC